ncbi:tumor necrosis factor receptor superfamily member 13C [Tamandua tetradactyla]|uniref:tumor necrosis factor receptor superfamily member 13C n=1 Tax=Tamandua tetradactyla TaxID=48850 RepID=UPI004053EA08
MVEWLTGGRTGRKRQPGVLGLGAGQEPSHPSRRRRGRGGLGRRPLPVSSPRGCGVQTQSQLRAGRNMGQGREAWGSGTGPRLSSAVPPAECFDPLLRTCVSCRLFRTPDPRPAGMSSLAPRTALQPQESVGAGARPEGAKPLPGLLFGAPALLGLALALLLVGLVSWRLRRRLRGAASPEAVDLDPDCPEPLDDVSTLSSGPPAATAPVWPPPKDPAAMPPGHSIPVPAMELGSTELVTTKSAGPEQP